MTHKMETCSITLTRDRILHEELGPWIRGHLEVEVPYDHGPRVGLTTHRAFSCRTLELPWRDNKRNESCIPDGPYKVVKRTYGQYFQAYQRRWGHKFSMEVANVEGRGDILIHTGNSMKDTRGCIIIGESFPDPGYPWIVGSRNAYNQLYRTIKDYDRIGIVVRKFLNFKGERDELRFEKEGEGIMGDRTNL